jgi:hypothetical protein
VSGQQQSFDGRNLPAAERDSLRLLPALIGNLVECPTVAVQRGFLGTVVSGPRLLALFEGIVQKASQADRADCHHEDRDGHLNRFSPLWIVQ